MRDLFTAELPGAVVSPLERTYLARYDFRAYLTNAELRDFIQGKCRLAVDYGDEFEPAGEGFLRLNPTARHEPVETAARRIVRELHDRT